MSGPTSPAAATGRKPSFGEFTWGLFVIGVSGFGGVLPWARLVMVERRKWLTAAEFNDLLALSQFMPGPNIINMAVVMGGRLHGLPGAVVGLLALMGAPFAIACGLGAIYVGYGHSPIVDGVMRGVAPVAAGLMVATALKVAGAYDWRNPMGIFAVLAFVAIALLRVSLPAMLAVLVPLALLIAWRRVK